MNPYEVLGVPGDATPDDIKAAYRRLSKEHHPDRNPGCATAAATYAAVQDAHELLSDPARRAAYDATGADPGRPRGDAEFTDLIVRLLFEVVAGIGGFNTPESVDVMDRLRGRLADITSQAERGLDEAARQRRAFLAVAGRLDGPAGDADVLGNALRAQAADLERREAQIKTDLERLTRARVFLKQYKYRRGDAKTGLKAMMSDWNVSTTWGTTTAGGDT